MIKSILALIGLIVIILFTLSQFGIGHFVIYYGPHQSCVESSSINF